MTHKNTYHGGLQFSGKTDGAIKRFSTIVAATLEDYGHLVERKSVLNPTEASIVSSQYLVRLSMETQRVDGLDHAAYMGGAADLETLEKPTATLPEHRLTITITPVSELLDDAEISELMLVVLLYRMVDICATKRVEWLAPTTVLTIEQFMSAFNTLAPVKQRDRKQIFESVSGPFTGHHEVDAEDLGEPQKTAPIPSARAIQLSDQQLLSIAFRTEPIEQKPVDRIDTPPPLEPEASERALKFTSWGMTGAVASVSLPIAASMAAVNLIRGEDFRLNTQVLAYSVAISALSASGAFAGVVYALGM